MSREPPFVGIQARLINGPITALEVAASAVERWGVCSSHTDVSDVPTVKVTADSDDFSRTPGVERQVQADVRDDVVEAFLPVEGGASERKR